MSVIYDYFAAPDDAAAGRTIDWVGGPSEGAPGSLFRRRIPGYEVVVTKSVEPAVVLGALDEMLTGRSFHQRLDDPASNRLIAKTDDGLRVVLGLDDVFGAALAEVDDARVAALAGPWSQIEEFMGYGDPAYLVEFTIALRELCRTARAQGTHVYCSIIV